MIISVVYTIIGLIFCFVLYLAFRAINTGMEAKKANKDLENSDKTSLDNQEDLIKKLIAKPERRLSAQEALDHKWLRKYAKEDPKKI